MPTARSYWLDLFTGTTWQEFLYAGATVSGFRDRRWKTVQQVKPGDYFLCYLTGVSRFIGVLEVTSEPYWDETPIWEDAVFPCRTKVEVIAALTPETAVPIFDLKEQLTIFQNLKEPATGGTISIVAARG
jgi:predicted RNA-binding protein